MCREMECGLPPVVVLMHVAVYTCFLASVHSVVTFVFGRA